MTTRAKQAEKLKSAIIYFVKQDKTVKLTKLMKLLYYLDFRHYQETGYSVTGQEYTAWRKGPVPVDVWAELRLTEDRACGLNAVLKALPAHEDEDDFGFNLRLVPGAKFYEGLFTDRELRILKNVSEIFKGVAAKHVVDATHMRGKPWETTVRKIGEKAKIEYDLALEGVDQDTLERIREDQRDRQALSKLFGAEL